MNSKFQPLPYVSLFLRRESPNRLLSFLLCVRMDGLGMPALQTLFDDVTNGK